MEPLSFREFSDVENAATNSSTYSPLPAEPEQTHVPATHRRTSKGFAVILVSVMVLVSLIVLILNQSSDSVVKNIKQPPLSESTSFTETLFPPSRGPAEGVSEKANVDIPGSNRSYPWTNEMFSWQRTAYHFQPVKNWMNDPDGPLYHMGWYHLFYQYNPFSAVWGNISWGHAVSTDMIHWLYLPFAMVPDHWFDFNGVWTGSATLLPDGQIVVLYTGYTDNYVQVQNLAYPANLSDPLLLDWVKYLDNPVITPPDGIAPRDFRDPTTAWVGPDGKWRVTLGSKINKTGFSLVYSTTNFTTFEAEEGVLHSVEGTGMWECVDFYPVSTTIGNGLDNSAHGPDVKHVLKASLDDDKHDYYAIGVYDLFNNTWTPDNPEEDVGIGLRVDYGKYYASKTFYDQSKGRRILWGWVGETDSELANLEKGWASIQSIPRVVVFDNRTRTNLIQWPIEEIESLRLNSTEFSEVRLGPGSVLSLNISSANQLDIMAEFEVDSEALEATVEADVIYNCSTSSGAAGRGALGPFGLLVLAEETLSELTPVYFYIAKATDGSLQTFVCADESRSTIAKDVKKQIYGGLVPVLNDEKLSLRVLVDHSVVEAFAQGGRTVITSRIYPTEAIYDAAQVFLFNNATGVNVTANVKIWQMDSADIHPFPFDQM